MSARKSKFLIFLLIGVAAFLFGLIGFYLGPQKAGATFDGLWDFSNAFYSTLLLFAFGGEIEPDTHPLIHLARFMAVIAVSAAVIQIIGHQLTQRFWVFRARCWKNHLIVIGMGARGSQFALSAIRGHIGSGRVVVVDPVIDSARATQLRSEGINVIEGYGEDKLLLSQLGVHRAAHVIAVTPSDASNVKIAQAVSTVLKNENLTDTPCIKLKNALGSIQKSIRHIITDLWPKIRLGKQSNAHPLRHLQRYAQDAQTQSGSPSVSLFVHLADDQIRQTLRDHNTKLDVPREKLRIEPFSGRELVVAEWLRNTQLHSYAKMRGNTHIHLVFIGLDAMAREIIHSLVRIAPCPTFEKPHLTLLLADFTEGNEEQCDGLARLLADFPALPKMVELTVRPYRPLLDPLDLELLQATESEKTVSAIVISLDNDDLSSTVALRLRAATRQHDYWRAPIYVHVRQSSGLESAICSAANAKRLSDVVEPFGTLDKACTVDALVQFRDVIPRMVHEAYQIANNVTPEHSRSNNTPDRLRHWDELKETFRTSNRRQADHIPVKLAHLGLARVEDKATYSLPLDYLFKPSDEQRETLARTEHDSWHNDRLLDGWQASSIRDDKRLHHDTMVDYEQLTEEYKEYDREAVDLLTSPDLMRHTLDHPAWRPEKRIALIGHNHLSTEEAHYADQQMREHVLPSLLAEYPDHLLTFVTPLAPGSDLILAKAVTDISEKTELTGRIRLLIVEAIPREVMVDDYQSSYEAEGWPTAQARWNTRDNWLAARTEILSTLESVQNHDATQWILELTEHNTTLYHWNDQNARQQAYQRASHWMITQADELVAVCDAQRSGGIGGTQASLREWAENEQEPAHVIDLQKTPKP